MANVMSLKQLKNNPTRDGFDLSKRVLFTANVGEILPIYCREVIPGDKFKINVKSFTRTRPVQTAAFTRIREYVDFVFVPTNLLWNKFNTFVSQMTNNNQHATSLSSNSILTDEHPYFTLQQLRNMYSGLEAAGGNDIMGISRAHGMRKLMSYLRYGDLAAYDGTSSEDAINPVFNPKLNPFPILAYQKIYSDYFRHSQWENAFAPSWNLDYISGASGTLNIPISPDANNLIGNEMFMMRYANWNKDLFMGVLPNTQYGSSASVDLSSLINPTAGYFNSLGNSTWDDDGVDSQMYIDGQGNIRSASSNNTQVHFTAESAQNIANSLGLTTSNLQSVFTILALRQAEALQKWQEITQSVGQDYKSQLKAHWNVTVSDAYSDRSIWVDGISDTLDINEVVNQNLTGANVADIQGKGVGVNDGYINFSSDVHGYLMAVYHAAPLLDYSIRTGIPRVNLKTTAVDYAVPEFDRIGMQAVPLIEITNGVGDTANVSKNIIGYAPRYYDYKTDIDEIFGGFVDGGLQDWVAPVTEKYIRTRFVNGMLFRSGAFDYTFFKVNPAILNTIFDVSVGSNFYNDQLRINMNFDIKAVRSLDRDGLPY